MALIKITEGEGEIFNKYLYSRLIRNNKNVLGVELGATGSGKSYRDLRKAELWYDFCFKEEFPIENICFGIPQFMKRLKELLDAGKLRKGEILIFEEAGANLGSLDFQNKLAKMFTYVLQSFRSMNIAIFFNLPYLSMLNKTVRMLIHCSSESAGINFKKKLNKCKPFFHQVNQSTGKIYKKYIRVKKNGKKVTIKKFLYAMPEDRLIIAYEEKKAEFLDGLTKEVEAHIDSNVVGKERRVVPSKKDFEIYDYWVKKENQRTTAEYFEISQPTVHRIIKKIGKWRDGIKMNENTKKIT